MVQPEITRQPDGSAPGRQEDTGSNSASRSYRIFLLHHTHWDREWWATFQVSRMRLVELIDELLDTLSSDPTFRSFLLDGQMIVLRDYLEVRPENQEALVSFLRAGRIQCGPWYVLADEFLVSGEAHIRNLLLGRRVARELDCPLLDVGYMPDTFGHLAQMPQILRGFGIDNAFVWRGRGGVPRAVKQEFLWEAPDGSSVLTHWFPFGYYWMPFLHFGNPDRPYEDKLGRIYRSIEELGPRATTDALLLPYGGDHRPIDRDLPAKIVEANEAIGTLGTICWSTAGEYLAAVRERKPALETVHGELRASGPTHPHMLFGVLSARIALKEMNVRCQTWLERYAETLSALDWLRGGRYDAGLLWKAWDLLIQNHPHDSICGCSIDPVHREMVTRFEGARQIAQAVAERSAQHLNSRIDTAFLEEGDRALVVHNPLPWKRPGWATVWIPRDTDETAPSPRTHRLQDPAGCEVPFQVRDVEGLRPAMEGWRHTEVGFVADAVPGLGYRAYRLTRREIPLDPRQLSFTVMQPAAMLKGSERVTDLAIGNNTLENRWLRVEVDARDGTLTVTDRSSGRMYRGLNCFEDGGDAGDAYTYSAPLNDVVLRSNESARAHVSVAEAGYARATLRIDLEWELPAELSSDRLSRSSSYVETRLSTFVTLVSDSRWVDVTTEWENRSKDHRLRALFPLGVSVTVSHAQEPFEIARRPAAMTEPGTGRLETNVPTQPQAGWVSIDEGGRGLMVANRGLPEFEILDDGRGTIAVTLLRAFGSVSREDMLARTGGAGPATPAPDAQHLGRNRVRYAIIPHTGGWLASRSYRVAEEYLAPLFGSSTGGHTGVLPPVGGCVELDGEHTLLLSACKKAELDDALILRFWNVAEEQTEARVRLAPRPRETRYVDLKEEPLTDDVIPMDERGRFTLRAGPAQIVTVAAWF